VGLLYLITITTSTTTTTIIITIIIIFILIRTKLGHDRLVSSSSNILFKGLPSRLLPLVYNSALV